MSVRDRIAAILSGQPQTGWGALPQSQNVIDERQPYPYAPPQPLRLVPGSSKPTGWEDIIQQGMTGPLRQTTVGPDPWGLQESAATMAGWWKGAWPESDKPTFAEDVALRRAISADRRFTDVLEPPPAPPPPSLDEAQIMARQLEAEAAARQMPIDRTEPEWAIPFEPDEAAN